VALSSFIDVLLGVSPILSDFPEPYEFKALPDFDASGSLPESSSEADAKMPKGKAKVAALDPVKRQELIERGAAELVILLQREGRLLDFLEQDIEDFDDDDVGAAVRAVHKGCREVVRKHFDIGPVLPELEEDDDFTVEEGFNPEEIRLLGKVKGSPPFKGTLRHPGWRAQKVSMPKVAASVDVAVLASAEVEV